MTFSLMLVSFNEKMRDIVWPLPNGCVKIDDQGENMTPVKLLCLLPLGAAQNAGRVERMTRSLGDTALLCPSVTMQS
jgi:hypothetical protein